VLSLSSPNGSCRPRQLRSEANAERPRGKGERFPAASFPSFAPPPQPHLPSGSEMSDRPSNANEQCVGPANEQAGRAAVRQMTSSCHVTSLLRAAKAAPTSRRARRRQRARTLVWRLVGPSSLRCSRCGCRYKAHVPREAQGVGALRQRYAACVLLA
jgi:hypothetical protein